LPPLLPACSKASIRRTSPQRRNCLSSSEIGAQPEPSRIRRMILAGTADYRSYLDGSRAYLAMKPTRCQTCKEILFVGRPDPMEQNSSGLGGWYGAPLAVCLGSWRNLWRRKWYHQTCCGVYTDQTDRTGLYDLGQISLKWSKRPDTVVRYITDDLPRHKEFP
jgi:hypothetical protein